MKKSVFIMALTLMLVSASNVFGWQMINAVQTSPSQDWIFNTTSPLWVVMNNDEWHVQLTTFELHDAAMGAIYNSSTSSYVVDAYASDGGTFMDDGYVTGTCRAIVGAKTGDVYYAGAYAYVWLQISP